MARVLRLLIFGLAGYLIGAVLGYALVAAVSANTHDRSLEAIMTAAFVAGPAGAIVGGAISLFGRRAS